ncbi:dihydroxyacetone kinase subunit L [Planctomycetales bacterium]|nr:dihydroxyacetone kinase subunit L [Planctomycetales bacterium]
MLASALSAIESNVEMLNQLDAATGDGDHGTAILAAMKAAAAASQKEGGLAATLEIIGWEVMSSTNGSTSTLLGSFFVGMSSGVNEEEPDVPQAALLFESGLQNVRTSTKAVIGDKTMMDALIPAVEAMTAIKNSDISLAELLQTAAAEAKKGADSTKELVAKQGRAKNLGERSRGHLDAGAVSTALIFQAYADTIKFSPQV